MLAASPADPSAALDATDVLPRDAWQRGVLAEEAGRHCRAEVAVALACRPGDPPSVQQVVTACCATGAAARCVEVADAYSRQRVTFGSPLQRHQAVRLRIAELRVQVEASRCLNDAAVEAWSVGNDLRWPAAAAHGEATRLVRRAAEECLSIHGALGYLDSHPVSAMLRDANVLAGTDRAPIAAPAPTSPAPLVHDRLARRLPAWQAETEFPVREVLQAVAEAGVLGTGFAADLGGIGGGLSRCVALHEDLARLRWTTLSMAVLSHLEIGTRLVAECATPAVKASWVPAALSGEAVIGFAATEPQAGSDPASTVTSARRDGSGWVVDGIKRYITNARHADALCVLARTSERSVTSHTLLLVPMATPGISVSPLGTIGNRGTLAEVRFDGARASPDAVLGGVGQGLLLQIKRLAHERAFLAVVLAALAGQALDVLDADGRRRTDLAVDVEKARCLAHHAVGLVAAGADARRAAAMAKLVAARAYRDVTLEAVRVHGWRDGEPEAQAYLDAVGLTLAGGTEAMLLEGVCR